MFAKNMRSLLTIFVLGSCVCYGDEYRYHLMATTELKERVFDKNGKETMIVFSKKPDLGARQILNQLLRLKGIHGTNDVQ